MLGYGLHRCALDGDGSTDALLAAASLVGARRWWPSLARSGCAVLVGGGHHRDALDGGGSTDARSVAAATKTCLTAAAPLMCA
jgi:hypothetical protein